MWTNFSRTLSCQPAQYVYAEDVEHVSKAVKTAAETKQQIRPVGASHSYSPVVATDGIIVDVSTLRGVTDLDPVKRRVTVGAGTKISELGDPLWAAGLSLSNQGDIDSQTIAGAISTGTHGSGANFGSISSMVTGIEMITATGDFVKIEEDDPLLPALQTAVGALGIITGVQLQVMDAYQLVETNQHWPLEEVRDRWVDEIANRRHFSFFWGPYEDSLQRYGLPSAVGMRDACYVKSYQQIPADEDRQANPGERIDRGYRIYADVYPPNYDELEYFVPLDQAFPALTEVAKVLERFPEQHFPVEMRTIRADRGLISPMFQQDSVALAVSGEVGTSYDGFLEEVHSALSPFGARPHWGKRHYFDAAQLQTVFPDSYSDFVATRRSMDPDSIFVNDHLRTMFA
jgi:FAD/FMN-containing dehydrogenase